MFYILYMDHNNILGTVLAGGKSQRFGEDKSQVKLAGKLLIDHMLTEIIDEFKELLIVSNNKISFHNSDKISIIEDFETVSYTHPSPRDRSLSRMPSSA